MRIHSPLVKDCLNIPESLVRAKVENKYRGGLVSPHNKIKGKGMTEENKISDIENRLDDMERGQGYHELDDYI